MRFAQIPERVSNKSFVVLIIGNSKSNHLGAQGTFKGYYPNPFRPPPPPLSPGFEPQLRDIVDRLPKSGGDPSTRRQTCMFSATWPEEVRLHTV